jgi:hypothetical protein
MKVYPNPPSEFLPDGGFTAQDIRLGNHWLRTDVECTECKHVMPLAMAGSTDNGVCTRCGGKTS